jgi:hypothetical protein
MTNLKHHKRWFKINIKTHTPRGMNVWDNFTPEITFRFHSIRRVGDLDTYEAEGDGILFKSIQGIHLT